MRTVSIIPAYNDSERLPQVVSRARAFTDHVVVVDDGSRTPIQLRPDPAVTIVRHRINLGKGAALKTGVLWATQAGYEAAVFIDADGQHDPNEIPKLLAPVIHRQADIAFGTRQFNDRMPFVARAGNLFLSAAARVLFGIHIQDTQSGYRAIHLPAYSKLAWESPRYAVETEMVVNAGKHRLRYVEVPISTIYHDRYKGTTIFDGIRIFISMITWRII